MSVPTATSTAPRWRDAETVLAQWPRFSLLVGYLTLTAGVLVARSAPSTGYEVDIYAATPAAFWIGVVGAATVGILAALHGDRPAQTLGVGLAGLSTVAFLGLPFVRGYYFYGSGDALTHLGWARRLLTPEFGFFDLLYPGGHTLSVFLSQAMGVSVRWGMMYAVLAVSVITLLFVPLSVWVVVRDRRAAMIGAFTAMLMLPINNISTHPHFHSYTLTTLYFPFVLYLVFAHLTRSAEDDALPGWLSVASLLLPVALAATVFYHPQVAVNVLVLLGTVTLVGLALRRRGADPRSDGPRRHRLLVGPVAFLACLLALWASQFEQTYLLLENLTAALRGFVATGSGVGAVAQSRGQSASSIGVSLVELFAKLFGVSAVYVALCAGLVGAKLFGVVNERQSDTGVAVTYIGFSALTLGPFFLVQFVGDVSSYFFRHLGFAMVLVGVVGAVALFHLSKALEGSLSGRGRSLVGVVAVVALCLSLVAFYPSPYMYNPSGHTPEQRAVGYAALFEHSADGAAIAGIRSGPGRFTDAQGVELDPRLMWSLGEEDVNSLASVVGHRQYGYSDRAFYYLVVSEMAREREIVGYHGIRYTEADFERIEGATTPRISLVQTNGDFDVYHVDQGGLPLDPT
jgi:hypothetical protein